MSNSSSYHSTRILHHALVSRDLTHSMRYFHNSLSRLREFENRDMRHLSSHDIDDISYVIKSLVIKWFNIISITKLYQEAIENTGVERITESKMGTNDEEIKIQHDLEESIMKEEIEREVELFSRILNSNQERFKDLKNLELSLRYHLERDTLHELDLLPLIREWIGRQRVPFVRALSLCAKTRITIWS